MSLSADQIGATTRFNANFAYAYRMLFRNGYILSAGLHAGVANWHSDWFKVAVQQGSDLVFREKDSRWMPNLGAGVYLSNNKFYAGLSCPNLIEYVLRNPDQPDADMAARLYRHYYAMVGGLFNLKEKALILRPSLLVKNTSLFSDWRQNGNYRNVGSPTEVDLDLALIFNQTFWVGSGLRQPLNASGSTADIWAAWQLDNGMRFGAAYDIVLSRLRTVSSGSFELMLGWEFDMKIKKAASIRYF